VRFPGLNKPPHPTHIRRTPAASAAIHSSVSTPHPFSFTSTMPNSPEIRVFAPATVANVACGYDVLGFAIDSPGDEIVVRHADKPGLRITQITGDNGKLPKNPTQNTAGVAREILPTQIPLVNATQQIGNLGGLLCVSNLMLRI
jgi:homoserine kinase